MAASLNAQNVSNTPLSNNRSSNGTGPSPKRLPRLPDGPCNFKNLSVGGADPPRCGCQRFWDKSSHIRTQPGKSQYVVGLDQMGWCMCEHHACFHQILDTRDIRGRSVTAIDTWGSSSQLSRRADSSLTSRVHSQRSNPDSQQPAQVVVSYENYLDGSLGTTGHEVQDNELRTQSAMPDTLRGSLSLPPESLISSLPPIPPQCNLPGDSNDGGLTAHFRSSQSFPGQDWSDFTKIPAEMYDAAQNSQSISAAGVGGMSAQSVTDAFTPRRGSPDLSMNNHDRHVENTRAAVNSLAPPKDGALLSISQSIAPGNHMEPTPLDITTVAVRATAEVAQTIPTHEGGLGALVSTNLLPHLQTILRQVSAHPTLSTRVDNHEQRLDLVENISSSFAGAQEVHEKFGLVDERIDELDSRVEDMEKSAAMNEANSFTSRHRRLRPIDDDDSTVSQTSTDLVAAAIDRSELSTRLENIEIRMNDLEALASPSWAFPWHVEVVLLPFGKELRGIWSTFSNFPSCRSRQNSTTPDVRMQTQYGSVTGGYASLGISSAEPDGWELAHRQSETAHDWLLPRACSPGGKVEERLRSRGLIKMIEVRGPNARDIRASLHAAFRDVPIHPPEPPDSLASHVPDSLRHLQGLFESWIPLRKIHKDSRLRFLDSTEMMNPVLWNHQFLQTVVMKAAGVRRLFVTNQESYIQNSDEPSIHWTWQKLRLLPRVFPDTQPSIEVREADALETCWKWDERLDPPPSVHSSFFTQHSPLSIRQPLSQQSQSSESEHSSSRASPAPSTTPTSARPVSPLLERTRPQRARTASMPIPLKLSPPLGKRRIASFDYERNILSSPQPSPTLATLAMKRRRISRSPSRPRDTPRWSVGPPSPFCHEEPAEHKRATTPFAYATPHSNAPYVDFRGQSVGPMADHDNDEHESITDHISLKEEDHEVDSDGDQEQHPEDEPYEGLGDEMIDDDSDQERNALSQDEDDDASSELSSQPSEYPSTQPSAKYTGNRGSFHIHVDEEFYGGDRPSQR